MKKVLMMLGLGLILGTAAQAQTEKAVTKTVPTSTPTQRVHNTFSHNKRHNGYRVKTVEGDNKITTKVNTTTGATKTKND